MTKPSGLRNPQGAVRALGAATLILEALVLVLGIQPLRVMGGDLSGAAVWTLVALAVACVALAGLLRHAWAWYGAAGLQVVLLLGGFLHGALAVLGVLFGLVWLYVFHVRRTILNS